MLEVKAKPSKNSSNFGVEAIDFASMTLSHILFQLLVLVRDLYHLLHVWCKKIKFTALLA